MNPIKPNIKTEIVPLLIIFLSIFFGIYFYSAWPDVVASHWDFNGEVDGYSNKFAVVWIFLAIISLMYAMFLALPYIDPKKKNYKSFSGFYHFFKALILSVMFLSFLFVGIYNLGYPINVSLLANSSIGLLMVIIGFFLRNIKPNWFIGIKNPWTLSSDNVWAKTHKVGGYFFMIFGAIIIACNFLPKIWAMILFILGILSIIIGTAVYSYVIYNKESKKSGK